MNAIRRIEGVDQLRGLAALSVAWFHLTNQYDDWVALTGSWGWLGVEAFFVISGFVIPLSLAGDWQRRGRRALPLFLARRLVRIEPPYLASVLLVVVLNFAAAHTPGFRGGPPDVSATQVFAHAAYLIPLTHYEWLQPVYWTLAFEFAFYIAMAGLIGVLASTRRVPVWACLAALLGLIALDYASPLLGLFAMGCLVFRANTGRGPIFHTVIAIGFAGLAMTVAGAFAQALVGLLVAGLILAPQSVQGVTGLAGRGLKALGTISFSLYLLHVPVGGKIVNLGQRWLMSPGQHLALSIVALAGSLLAAALFWRLIELPCMRAAGALARHWKPAQPSPMEA